jgi:nucleoside-diphosphate-sugar epimerase
MTKEINHLRGEMSVTSPDVLVTGATGMVGSRILTDLLRQGRKVRAMYRKGSDRTVFERQAAGLSQQVDWVEGDITEVLSVFDALEGVKEIYHAAGLVSFLPSDRERLIAINAEGTANVVNMALERGVLRICHISSVAALGRSESGMQIDETTVWKNSKYNSVYAISKFNAEREVWRGMEEGLQVLVLNPSIILGPGNPDTGSSLLFRAVKDGLRLYPTGTTGFVDVRDVSRLALSLMEQGRFGERFVVNSENLAYRELFGMIAEAFGKQPPSVRVPDAVMHLAWRLEKIRSTITGKMPLITRETATTSTSVWKYDASLSVAATGVPYIPIRESVNHWTPLFQKAPHDAEPGSAVV